MRPVEHYISQLDRIDRGGPRAGAEETAVRGFTDLTAAVIGRDGARDLCNALLGLRREKPGPGSCLSLGYAAAFLLGEFDDSMELNTEEWEEIRAALEEAAGGMDLNTLTALMGELLSRGKLF
ncbi:MAG: hypothetical protein LBB77_05220 [Treponema sp.]|jgi:hypothetical protein|nr:hypothetical protein [Treponema sp.]